MRNNPRKSIEDANRSIEEFAEGIQAHCSTGKRCYKTKERAKKVIKDMLNLGGNDLGKLNAYRCRKCRFFHVGNKKPWLADRPLKF